MMILVVDDDADQRQLRAMVLSRGGFKTTEAGDKQRAILQARVHRPAAAIVDLRLPTVNDGLELIQELKSFDPRIRIIVLTGTSRQMVKDLRGAELIDELLIKPAPSSKLIGILRFFEANQ
jgi:CheY-like chemotaxis protein